ncbi:MAG: hypothetical protein QM606_07995 [Leucobacter sp.]
MTPEPIEPNSEAAEADLLDQFVPADPGDEDEAPQPLSTAREPVSEGDWAEQQRPVPLDDDRDDAEA